MFAKSASKLLIFYRIAKNRLQILSKISNFAAIMAGIYIHIPFCKSRCIYCGFYSTTRQELRQRYVDAVCRELETRRNYLGNAPIETIYLGGGTPSLLTEAQLQQLFLYINKVYDVSPDAEVTMECNPDDMTEMLASAISSLPVNRVSMGAQTFDNERLRFLHRRHSAEQVSQAVGRLRAAGILNISIDLIYGFPQESLCDWHHDIDAALALDVEHLSAYSLMFEEGTPLYRQLEQGQVKEIDEELALQMYNELTDRLEAAGYEHYEISNYAKRMKGRKGSFRSRHNSSYWNQTPYIGLGAAAHSYDGNSRQWNISDLSSYIEGIENEHPHFELEQLNEDTSYNDLILTSLRTCEGLPLTLLTPDLRSYLLEQAQSFIDNGQLVLTPDHRLRLTRQGIFVSNLVMSQLMKV
jgi:oxygen-independent coproporphyrinogen-3 oxidase